MFYCRCDRGPIPDALWHDSRSRNELTSSVPAILRLPAGCFTPSYRHASSRSNRFRHRTVHHLGRDRGRVNRVRMSLLRRPFERSSNLWASIRSTAKLCPSISLASAAGCSKLQNPFRQKGPTALFQHLLYRRYQFRRGD